MTLISVLYKYIQGRKHVVPRVIRTKRMKRYFNMKRQKPPQVPRGPLTKYSLPPDVDLSVVDIGKEIMLKVDSVLEYPMIFTPYSKTGDGKFYDNAGKDIFSVIGEGGKLFNMNTSDIGYLLEGTPEKKSYSLCGGQAYLTKILFLEKGIKPVVYHIKYKEPMMGHAVVEAGGIVFDSSMMKIYMAPLEKVLRHDVEVIVVKEVPMDDYRQLGRFDYDSLHAEGIVIKVVG